MYKILFVSLSQKSSTLSFYTSIKTGCKMQKVVALTSGYTKTHTQEKETGTTKGSVSITTIIKMVSNELKRH